MTPEIKWDELLELAQEKGIDAIQLRWLLDIVKPESDAVEFAEWAYDNNWLIQSDKSWWNFQAQLDEQVEIPTTELYEIYLQSLQLNK